MTKDRLAALVAVKIPLLTCTFQLELYSNHLPLIRIKFDHFIDLRPFQTLSDQFCPSANSHFWEFVSVTRKLGYVENALFFCLLSPTPLFKCHFSSKTHHQEGPLAIIYLVVQAQSDDDDVGPEDVAVNVEGRDGFMDAFFGEVCPSIYLNYRRCPHRTSNISDNRRPCGEQVKELAPVGSDPATPVTPESRRPGCGPPR
jgi:hypothetical protein